MGSGEDNESYHSIHTFKPSYSRCLTASFGDSKQSLRSVGSSDGSGPSDRRRSPEKRLDEALRRWRSPPVLQDPSQPNHVPMPEAVLSHAPSDEEIGLRMDEGESQLRFMFGNLLSDLVAACGPNTPLPPGVAPSVVLAKPYPIELSDFEKQHIKEMKRFLKVQNIRLYGTAFEDGRYLLRFLQGNRWDYERATEDIRRHMEWRCATHPIRHATVAHTMPSGFVYIHGRDRCFRPILVLRTKNMKDVPEDEILPLLYYWLEYIVNNLLYPTRVEQWNVIIDLAESPFYTVPVLTLRDIAVGLQRNYMGRLSRIFIVNYPLLFYGVWRVISMALKETTVQKIMFVEADLATNVHDRIDSSQLEERYGGSCPEVKDFSIPTMPDTQKKYLQ